MSGSLSCGISPVETRARQNDEKAPGRPRLASRTPGPLRLFPVQRLAVPSGDKWSTACLGRALVPHAASVNAVRVLEALPNRAPSGSRPVLACAAPTGLASRSGPTSRTIRSRCCAAPTSGRNQRSSRLALAMSFLELVAIPVRMETPSRLAHHRCLEFVFAEPDARFGREESCSAGQTTASAARTLGYPFAPPAVASSCELRSLSTHASNTRPDRRSRGHREIHRSSTDFPRNPQLKTHLSQGRAQIHAQLGAHRSACTPRGADGDETR